jgi:DNA-binding MarR family transcriptional regulator
MVPGEIGFGGAMTERRPTAKHEANDALAPASPEASGAVSKRRNGQAPRNLGALKGHLGYFLRRAQVSVFQDFIRTLSSIDIRPAQYSVLIVIGANPGLSQADVAELLGIERARLVRLLDRLERRGVLRRQASPNDRRSHSLHLTPAGRGLLKRAKALAATHEARLLERLGPLHHKMMIDALHDFELSD